MQIHDSEPIRISRSITDYQTLFNLPKSKIILAFDGNELVAYLMFGWSTNKPGIIESGGLTEGIETLIKYVLENELLDETTQALVPLHKTTMGDLLHLKNHPYSHHHFHKLQYYCHNHNCHLIILHFHYKNFHHHIHRNHQIH